MIKTPGTVSKILWHFTGGPKWDSKKNCQTKERKPSGAAYNALVSILTSRELRVGQYKEVVKIRAELLKRVAFLGQAVVFENYVDTTMTSDSVCCLADIPIVHLPYHAERYGKMAVGFHRQAVVRNEFNPVFYTMENSRVIAEMYSGFALLKESADFISLVFDDTNDDDVGVDAQFTTPEQRAEILRLKAAERFAALDHLRVFEAAEAHFKSFLAFTKSFNDSEFATIYPEREWRSTKPFKFKADDIAMLVAPKSGKGHYHARLVERCEKLGLPRTIPIVAWEDLVEH